MECPEFQEDKGAVFFKKQKLNPGLQKENLQSSGHFNILVSNLMHNMTHA